MEFRRRGDFTPIPDRPHFRVRTRGGRECPSATATERGIPHPRTTRFTPYAPRDFTPSHSGQSGTPCIQCFHNPLWNFSYMGGLDLSGYRFLQFQKNPRNITCKVVSRSRFNYISVGLLPPESDNFSVLRRVIRRGEVTHRKNGFLEFPWGKNFLGRRKPCKPHSLGTWPLSRTDVSEPLQSRTKRLRACLDTDSIARNHPLSLERMKFGFFLLSRRKPGYA